jgi:hypothetical protein
MKDEMTGKLASVSGGSGNMIEEESGVSFGCKDKTQTRKELFRCNTLE